MTNVEQIEGTVGAFFDAWNQRDIRRIGPLLEERAELVNSLGLRWRGAAEVIRGLQSMNLIGPSLLPESMSTRLVTTNTAICVVVITVAGYTRPDGTVAAEQRGIVTFFLVNAGQRWLITGGQTTAVSPEVAAGIPKRDA